MRKYFVYIMLGLTFSFKLWAQMDSSSESPQELNVDESSFKKIFDQNVTGAQIESQKQVSRLDVEPRISYATLGNVHLKNRYFTVPISDQVSGIPFFQVSTAYRLMSAGNFRFDPKISIGYGFRQSTFNVIQSNNFPSIDTLSLHWIPLEAGMRLSYRVHGLSFLSLVSDPGIGVNWIHHSGHLGGINQSYWIPFGKISIGINFFDQSFKPEAWFGGVSIIAGKNFSFASSQKADMWTADLGVRFLL